MLLLGVQVLWRKYSSVDYFLEIEEVLSVCFPSFSDSTNDDPTWQMNEDRVIQISQWSPATLEVWNVARNRIVKRKWSQVGKKYWISALICRDECVYFLTVYNTDFYQSWFNQNQMSKPLPRVLDTFKPLLYVGNWNMYSSYVLKTWIFMRTRTNCKSSRMFVLLLKSFVWGELITLRTILRKL